ncbi:uncharacterized protein LOC127243065 isoform X2 [Andrographis paniculata]|nr:uncharacterized protein LOC127243065 isoform X2 [Andrographis paniculata]
MSSKGGFKTAAPSRLGDCKSQTPAPSPAGRSHRKPPLQQNQMRRILLQQLHHQQQQQQQQQRQQRSETVKKEATPPASAKAAGKRPVSGDSPISPPLYSPPPVKAPPAVDITNLDRVMEAVTPLIQARFLSEVNPGEYGVNSEPFYYMEDLWEAFNEWSVYGAGVPLLVNGTDPIDQYYVPFLSGIQMYIDQAEHSRRPGELGQTNVVESSKSKANNKGKSVVSAAISTTSQPVSAAFPSKSLLFQYLEYEQPYGRRPLTDKVSILASNCPQLNKCRSCDLLPISWLCVAWYPIYRIPVGPTLKDLEASFLTFHSLSTHPTSMFPAQFHPPSTKRFSSGGGTAKISLPVFALAAYKLKGSIVSPCEPIECAQEIYLMQEAENWLRSLEVHLPDYHFFRIHSFRR